MKKVLLSAGLSLLALAGIAQTNPTVTNAAVSPDPIPGANPYATLEFVFANLGPDPISNLDVDGNDDPIILKISLQNGESDNVHFADPVAAVGGSYASFFTWTYDAATKTYTGAQNKPITGFDGGNITIGYKATTATPSVAANNGFTVNLTSNSNAPNGDGTNDINDDYTRAVTYVDGVLPVTLLSFNAGKEGKVAQLTWATTEETNSDRFDIQRSPDGKSWTNLGSVTSTGESSTLRNYRFADKTPQNGENLYRLKMEDKDGTFAYSTIRALHFEGLENDSQTTYVYPNPSADRVFLNRTDVSAVKEVAVVDMNGRPVLRTSAIADGVDVRKLTAGTYMLKVSGADGSSTVHKFVISR